jgi:predicted  nucleic acid-binding Zn ribbon protein
MYLKLIKFSGSDIDYDTIENLLSAWHNSGQIISQENTIFNMPNGTKTVSVICAEDDSLDQRWNNSRVDRWLTMIDCDIEITTTGVLENTFIDKEAWMSCKFILLFFSPYFLNNPIRDGVTLNPVPLYFIPKTTEDDDYFNLLSFSKVYVSFGQIEDFDSTYQKNYLDELYNFNSNLNKLASELCHKIEKLISKPVFLYLDHYTYDSDIHSELNRLLNKNETFIDINNEPFQLINLSDRIVSRITPNLLDEARLYYKDYCKLEPIDAHTLGNIPIRG